MRRVIVISYTETGRQLNSRIADCLRKRGDVAVSYGCGSGNGIMSTKRRSLADRDEKEDGVVLDGSNMLLDNTDVMSTDRILRREWDRTTAFVFIGAMGIAVRHAAPFLKSKVSDPAVLVLDEKGQYVIPVLSGHIGGGVALARELAGDIGGQAVITTATDVEDRFAVDVFAYKNHLWIENPGSIKAVSSALLRGQTADVWTSVPVMGEVPRGLRVLQAEEMAPKGLTRRKVSVELAEREDALKDFLQQEVTGKSLPMQEMAVQKTVSDIAVLIDLPPQVREEICRFYDPSQVCVLKARNYILGVGCRKGRTAAELEGFLGQLCEKQGIDRHRIGAIASIEAKKEEAGIWELSRRLGVPFEVFTAQELERVEEAVTASAFVKETVGVDNVCERSAYALADRWGGDAARTETDLQAGNVRPKEDVSQTETRSQAETISQKESVPQADTVPQKESVPQTETMLQTGKYSLVLGKQAQDGMTMALVETVPGYCW